MLKREGVMCLHGHAHDRIRSRQLGLFCAADNAVLIREKELITPHRQTSSILSNVLFPSWVIPPLQLSPVGYHIQIQYVSAVCLYRGNYFLYWNLININKGRSHLGQIKTIHSHWSIKTSYVFIIAVKNIVY